MPDRYWDGVANNVLMFLLLLLLRERQIQTVLNNQDGIGRTFPRGVVMGKHGEKKPKNANHRDSENRF